MVKSKDGIRGESRKAFYLYYMFEKKIKKIETNKNDGAKKNVGFKI